MSEAETPIKGPTLVAQARGLADGMKEFFSERGGFGSPSTEKSEVYQPLTKDGFVDALAEIKAGGKLADRGWARFVPDGLGGTSFELSLDMSQDAGLLSKQDVYDLTDVRLNNRRSFTDLQELREQVETRAQLLEKE